MPYTIAGDVVVSLNKRFLKSKCKVTFKLPSDKAAGARRVYLVGEFNDWDPKATPMRKLKDGAFSATLDLEAGGRYQYRYLVDQKRWENDDSADSYAPTPYGDGENCIVDLTERA